MTISHFSKKPDTTSESDLANAELVSQNEVPDFGVIKIEKKLNALPSVPYSPVMEKRRKMQKQNHILFTTKAREKRDDSFYMKSGFSSSSPIFSKPRAKRKK